MAGGIAAKIQNRFRQLGWEGTARYSLMRAIDLAHDYAFDLRHGVTTRGVTQPAIDGAQGYKGSLPRLVREMLDQVSIRYEDYTFIDLGSGKGRTLLIASEYPFRRIIGVEYVPEINAVAQANIARFRSGRRKCGNVESVQGDARQFAFPNEPLLIYLYNPFREALMAAMLANLRRSLNAHPRPALVIYMRPLFGEVLERAGFLQKVTANHSRLIENFNYAIYRSTIGAAPSPATASLVE